jgi:ABC-type multidrug transport system fused ATPase/permease subunit
MCCFETSLTFILAIAIMTRVDWRLAMLAVRPAPAVRVAVILFGRVIHDRFEELNRAFIAQNIRLVRVQGLFQPLLEALIGVIFLVVLERGKIVERGTHDELVDAGGYYAELCQKQMLEEELEAI